MTDGENKNAGLALGMAALEAGLAGTPLGLALGRRAERDTDAALSNSVDALRLRAQRVLEELSDGVADRAARQQTAK